MSSCIAGPPREEIHPWTADMLEGVMGLAPRPSCSSQSGHSAVFQYQAAFVPKALEFLAR
jgi:hypothetical protein